MTDLFKAFVRSNWGAGVAGLRGTAGWVATSTGLASPGQVDDLSRALFQAGDHISESMIDSLADCLRAGGLTRNVNSVLDLSSSTARLLRRDHDGQAARQEFLNKLEVFRMVRYDQPEFGVRGTDLGSLRDAVTRAYDSDPHSALWRVEGSTHKYVAGLLSVGDRPSGLFQRLPDGMPESCVPMLHAGLGLAVAEHLLESYDPSLGDADEVVREFIRLCVDNSDRRFLDHGLEALGLVARCFYPASVPRLNEAVRRVAPEQEAPLRDALLDYLWHGIGRGIYFLPLSFIPGYGAVGRAIDTAVREAPDRVAADAALAGLAYAFTMVNMAHPEVIEALLRERGESLRGGPLARGLSAAFAARLEITPDYPPLQRLVDHRPEGVATLWEEIIRQPCGRP